MILLTNEFDVASAAYGILSQSDLKEPFWFETTSPIVSTFNYLSQNPGGVVHDLTSIKDPVNNELCWNELIEEAKQHMETIIPDPNVNFAVNQKVKSFFKLKYPTNKFIAVNLLPSSKPKSIAENKFLISSDPNIEIYLEKLAIWELDNVKYVVEPEVPINYLDLINDTNCCGYVGSSQSWLGVVATAGYKVLSDLKNLRPFFFSEAYPPFEQHLLTSSIVLENEYIKYRKELYETMVMFDFDHIKFLRNKYGKKT